MPLISNVIVFSHTATDDLKFRLVENDLWIREANIHITTQAAKYGDTNTQDAELSAGDVLTYQDFNLADLFFKNAGAGANTTVTAICILLTEGRKKELGVL
jgi:hypothetical protein